MTSIYTGAQLAKKLRLLGDNVQQRLWIASPYIGSQEALRRILGRAWWDRLDQDAVQTITDAQAGNINPVTIGQLRAKGPVKHLLGLHAKVYIIDDDVMLTSANLTRTAFACRHEIGIHLTGIPAQETITRYKEWWKKAVPITTKQLAQLNSKHSKTAGEDVTPGLTIIHALPPDPGAIAASDLFTDYEPFRTQYWQLAKLYAKNGRAWLGTIPLYLEVDAFLDFLFHHGSRPAKPYTTSAPRQLTTKAQEREIATYSQAFKRHTTSTGALKRQQDASILQGLLSVNRLSILTSADVETVLRTLNCMNDSRIRNRALSNGTAKLKNAWYDLLHGNAPLTERMTTCANNLFGFKRSSVQELLGWYKPNEYPLRNRNVNAGMRFLGYDVSAD